MRLWIDLSNAPHVLLFRNLIKEFKGEVLVTARDFSYIRDLLDLYGIEARIIGKHGGKSLEGKLEASIEREKELIKVVKDFKPNFFLSKYSVEGSRIAYGFGLKSLQIADNENGWAMNSLTFPLSNKLLIPRAIKPELVERYGAREVETFNGFCELAHLNGFEPNREVLKELGVSDRVVTMRCAPVEAHYFDGNNGSVLPQIIEELDCSVVVFPRNAKDKEKLEKMDVVIPEHGVDSLSLLYHSDVFVGEGGSMNRESCLLGTPTISCYPDKMLAVDQYLVDNGFMEHGLEPDKILEFIEKADKEKSRERIEEFKKELESPIEKVEDTLIKWSSETK